MKIRYILLIFILFIPLKGVADSFQDSSHIQKKINYHFIALDVKGGTVLATNDFVSGNKKIPYYSSLSVKYGRYAKGDKWQDYAFGMPYWGIGLYAANFFERSTDFGHPFSLYALQGATIKQFSSRLSLKYEWNLGMSFNWKPYDAFDNPNNVAIGSDVNIHVSVSAYLKWKLSKYLDIHTGLSLTHFSNGAKQYPNKGINMASPYVELVYNINPQRDHIFSENLQPPKLQKKIEQDISVLISSRQTRVDITKTGLPIYLDRRFKVFGFNYAALFVNNYKYKWGPSLELVYDESSQIEVWREKNLTDGKWYERVKLGSLIDRLSLGVSVKGETNMENFGIFANIGYNILHGNKRNEPFYQIMGIKLYFAKDFFGTFGIRANRFSKAEYIYWTLGYTIKGRER